ncbi:MAG: hypothetical protein Q7T58_07410 [Methylotenera sp.]|nr:hypothetical protein [Methylotenera sp.]
MQRIEQSSINRQSNNFPPLLPIDLWEAQAMATQARLLQDTREFLAK